MFNRSVLGLENLTTYLINDFIDDWGNLDLLWMTYDNQAGLFAVI